MRALDLTDILKTLQNLGLTVTEELRIPLTLPEGRRCFLYRFEVEAPADRIAALRQGEQRFVDALRALDEERATDDPLNGLILSAGLTWRDVEVLRTLRNHLLQIRAALERGHGERRPRAQRLGGGGPPPRRSPPASTPPRPATARRRWPRPTPASPARWRRCAASPRTRCCAPSTTCCARRCARTPTSGPSGRSSRSRSTAARSRACRSPRPLFEIYVHSRRLEGIHLRGGKVARGGIRWCDRHDDFRTEILGLMKTQMVKNSVIVPVGSKGGFVLKGEVPAAARRSTST